MATMPVEEGFYITSPFGARWGTTHWGTDFGRDGGSGGYPIFATKDGTIQYAGAASGFGQWVTIDHPSETGGGYSVYGHVIPEVAPGQPVREGQRIGRINPDSNTNGGVAPHLHYEFHRYTWAQPGTDRLDPMATVLAGAVWPGRAPEPRKEDQPSGEVIFGVDVSRYQNGFSLAAAKNEGMQFVIISTGDGDISDPVYQSHFEDAEAVGMPISAYHFLRRENMGSTIAQQVAASLRAMGDRRAPVWLDCENESGLSLWEIQEAKRLFEEAGVRVLGIYATASWWENQVDGGEPPTAPLGAVWVAHYGNDRKGTPESLYAQRDKSVWEYPLGDQEPAIWQFGQKGVVNGYEVDVNAFRGTVDDIRALFRGEPIEGEITVSQADRIIQEIKDYIDVRLTGPVGSDVKDIRQQLTGGRDRGEYPGWEQLGQDAAGNDLTVVDAIAATRHDIAAVRKDIQSLKKGK